MYYLKFLILSCVDLTPWLRDFHKLLSFLLYFVSSVKHKPLKVKTMEFVCFFFTTLNPLYVFYIE